MLHVDNQMKAEGVDYSIVGFCFHPSSPNYNLPGKTSRSTQLLILTSQEILELLHHEVGHISR